MVRLVLLSPGESLWDKENRFTGWADVDLSERGLLTAWQAGLMLKAQGYRFDVAFTSVLRRAVRSLWIILDVLDLMWIPVECSWHLNEQHCGALQGLNKAETAVRFGEAQVDLWHRGYDARPPTLAEADPRCPGHDARYRYIGGGHPPLTESLKDTAMRLLPYWRMVIAPTVKAGQKVLIVAHNNSLRTLIKELEDIPDESISGVSSPAGVPLVYELDKNLKPSRHYYLRLDEMALEHAVVA
jgi:2,3-bisphosphoglycerate-dependent phosphoglycerate mutase